VHEKSNHYNISIKEQKGKGAGEDGALKESIEIAAEGMVPSERGSRVIPKIWGLPNMKRFSLQDLLRNVLFSVSHL
jgi:hypothetical protein